MVTASTSDNTVVPQPTGRQTLVWGIPRVEPELPLIGEAVVEEIAGRLDPVDFNPTFFQLTAGLALRF